MEWEQFEIWRQTGDQWEMLAFFPDFDVATAMARNHSNRMRLVHSTYQDGVVVDQQVLAELGATRARIVK